ncbi:SUMO ligase SizA [Aphelenchoides avenae]|nr:SUMO ligase SizA [Aphelenchus avenae]
MTEPARGVDCTHFACFDLPTFLELKSRTPIWDCPFSACKKTLSLDTVVIDEYVAGVLDKVDDSVVKIELLPCGAWKPVEAEREATNSTGNPANSDDVQVVLDKSTTSNQKEVVDRIVPVSVLEELRAQIGDLLEQFNALGYKRLGGIAASLADMNIFVKEQIREAREQPNGARIAAGAPTMSEKHSYAYI